MSEKDLIKIGRVTHFYNKIKVAIVQLKGTLSVGDRILIRGRIYPLTTNFEQTVKSMQIEHKNIEKAESGQSIGLKVDQKVRKGDAIYRIK